MNAEDGMAQTSRTEHDGEEWAALLMPGSLGGNPNVGVVVHDWPSEGDGLYALVLVRGDNRHHVAERALRSMQELLHSRDYFLLGAEGALRRLAGDLAALGEPNGCRVSLSALHLSRDVAVTAVSGDARGFWLGPGSAEPLAPGRRTDAPEPDVRARPIVGAPPVVLLGSSHVVSALGDARLDPSRILDGVDKIYPARDRLNDTLGPLLSPDAAALFVAL